jgi:ABC-type Na+ efflux pump permease subunit
MIHRGIIFAKIIGGSAVALLTKGAAVAVLLTYAAERIMTMTGMNVNDTLDLASRSQQGYIDIINHLVDAILRKFEELDTILNKKIVNWLMNSHSWNENEAVDLIKHIGKVKDGIVSVIKSVAAFKLAIERGDFVQATLIVLNLGVVIFGFFTFVNDSWKSNVPVIVARL